MKFWKEAIIACSLVGATSAIAQSDSPTFNRIKERGYISIGHRDASVPFSYLDGAGEPVGYAVDICLAIVDDLKATLEAPDLDVRFVPVTSQTRIPLIANGTIEMECGSTTNNLRRQAQVDYLSTTFITGAKIATKTGSGIGSIADLDGKIIGLSQGTSSAKNIQAALDKLGVSYDVEFVKDHPRGWLSLSNGRVDAYGTDEVILFGLISKDQDPDGFAVVGDFISYDPYAIMVGQNDSQFRNAANAALVRLMRSGEIHELYAKWFEPGPTSINIPMSPQLKAAFELQALPD
ncbi:amino acid ABC transporter substrate-binding protein [Sagittula sp. NFXS13]|uniref:amino acid ABC transporter substrate-binding protein n=1 Tax=Sagittula sp. NFXS13 TaxID=2819095 RepID=UPI0032DF4F0A